MILKVQRNDPCPCGSGRKYKKCCLAQQREKERLVYVTEGARERRNEGLALAMEWLSRRHGQALRAAFEDLVSAIVEDGRALSSADIEFIQLMDYEWVLAEGVTQIEGQEVRLRDLALAGMTLEADQRLWLDRATAEPLRLWRVIRVDPGVGLEIGNVLDDSAASVYVNERSASQTLRPMEVFGARLGRWKDTWEVASFYEFRETETLNLLQHLEQQIDGDLADPGVARAVGRLIRDFWIEIFTRRPVRPEIVGPAGDRVELTTDHWQIVDPDELERRLALQPDVLGSREEGWTRLQDPDAEISRTLLALNPGKRKDRLETFAQTRQQADAGRAWIEEVAGPALRHLSREIVDPLSDKVLGGGSPRPAGAGELSQQPLVFQSIGLAGNDGPEMPAEIKSQLMAQLYRQQYQGIGDEPIPALGNKSPRQALKEPGGPRRVRLWLEGFERNEERMAVADGRQPVDLDFLWRQVGLEPPDR